MVSSDDSHQEGSGVEPGSTLEPICAEFVVLAWGSSECSDSLHQSKVTPIGVKLGVNSCSQTTIVQDVP